IEPEDDEVGLELDELRVEAGQDLVGTIAADSGVDDLDRPRAALPQLAFQPGGEGVLEPGRARLDERVTVDDHPPPCYAGGQLRAPEAPAVDRDLDFLGRRHPRVVIARLRP